LSDSTKTGAYERRKRRSGKYAGKPQSISVASKSRCFRRWNGRAARSGRFAVKGSPGKGPHDLHVPESLLWALIDFRAFRCVYHA